ncbi:MAG TPA: HYR domain-containing protein, partial [Acidimicrobiia bacterium]|nr:HYR domain-containing protein [Acidimicrobiia bacterium]
TNQDLKLLHCDDPNCADNTAPVLVLPEDVVVEADGSGGAVVEYSVSAVDGDDPDPVVSCVPVSGSVFAVGDTVVTCTATDASGNESSGSFTVTVTYEEPEGFRFIDVAVGHLFDAEIHWLRDEGITFGCNPPDNTRYCPDDSVTRGQMAAFLVRAFDLPAASEDPFVDTQESVFVDDIARLAAAGVTRGCNPPVNDRYCPDDPVTRGEMAAFLYRALHLRP